MINENINVKRKLKLSKAGGQYSIAYIDPQTSDHVYENKDIIKRFGGKWDNDNKVWFWFIGNTPEEQEKTFETYIRPCIEQLNFSSNTDADSIVKAIDELKANLLNSTIEVEQTIKTTYMPKSEILSRIEAYKQDLLNSLSESDLKSKLDALLKYRTAMGHKYSILNTILIYIQDSKATIVKAKSNWLAANREVVNNAYAILMWRPKTIPLSREEAAKVRENYLKSLGKTYNNLNITEKEELRILMNKPTSGFDLLPFYDISQTKQIEGREDLIGKAPELDWHEGESNEERVKPIYDALLDMAVNKFSLKVVQVDNLGGARGSASADGVINILKNSGTDVGLTKTLAHEISHELLHWKYVQTKNNELKSFFVGSEEGRDKVEQQAELSSWIVMKNFGFDLKTSINYIGLWGANEKNVIPVFDSIANVASVLIDGIEQRIKTQRVEGIDGSTITGLDVAKMIGLGDAYIEAENGLEEEKIKIKEDFYKTLDKLKKII